MASGPIALELKHLLRNTGHHSTALLQNILELTCFPAHRLIHAHSFLGGFVEDENREKETR
jgi:hypothetical protein